MEKPRTRSLPLLTAALSLAACSPGSPPDAGAPAAETAAPAPVALELAPALEAYRWQLEAAVDPAGASITALFPGPENRLGFEFSGGRVGVTGGCNRIGASYQVIDGSSLQIGQAQSTMMACPPPLADVDAAIGRILTGTLQAELQGVEIEAGSGGNHDLAVHDASGGKLLDQDVVELRKVPVERPQIPALHEERVASAAEDYCAKPIPFRLETEVASRGQGL